MVSSNIKLAGGFVLGVAVGSAALLWLYSRRNQKYNLDTDEGIGDVDSIVSEDEILEQKRLLSGSSETAGIISGNHDPTLKSSDFDYKQALSETEETFHSSLDLTDQSEEMSSTFEQMNTSVEDEKNSKPRKVLLLGLAGCGKSSLLNMLAKRPAGNDYSPTQGFNAVQIERDEMSLTIMEVGGNASTKEYWKNFMSDTSLLIYMIDGANHNDIEPAKNELKKLLVTAPVNDIPCLLISNKQDLVECKKVGDVFNKKDIREIGKTGNCNITLLDTTCVSSNQGFSSLGETILTVVTSLLLDK